LGRLRTRTYPDGGAEKFGYSARGLTAYTNQISLTNFYAYDAAGRRTFETNANAELLRYTNNAAGDLLSLTDRPVIASHSNCRALFDHGRNITDDQIKAIAQRGGVVSLMIQSFVLSKTIASVDDLLRHVNHAVELVGVEHVGFGYDFIEFVEGLDLMKMDYLPPDRPPAENAHKVVREIPTHEHLPVLTEALLRRGYSEADVGRLMGGNWLDFLTRALP